MMHRPFVAVGLAVLLAALAALPWYVPYFYIFIATNILIMGLFAASFNLVFGYAGMLSFGHAAFFGMGGYTAALLMLHFHTPFAFVLIASMATSGLRSLIIGYLSVRLEEVYFAMLTLAFGMMVFAVAHQWRSFTNGSDGIAGFAVTDLLPGIDWALGNPETYYFMTLALVLAAAAVLYLVTRSPFGLLLRAIRQNPERVSFCGVNVLRHRLIAFVISGVFSGLAGALFIPFNRIASPDMLHWTQSAEAVLMSILGGTGYFLG